MPKLEEIVRPQAEPTIGSIVLYVDHADGIASRQITEYAAIVIAFSQIGLFLTVFPSSGGTLYRHATYDPTREIPGTWHWPKSS